MNLHITDLTICQAMLKLKIVAVSALGAFHLGTDFFIRKGIDIADIHLHQTCTGVAVITLGGHIGIQDTAI